jgi:dihydroorotase
VLVIRGGDVVDAAGRRRADVAVDGGTVVAVAAGLDVPSGATVLDGAGCITCPGFVDLHTHLRQPGGEEAETVETGARGAALGGYTAVVAMPNTSPALDSVDAVAQVMRLGRAAGLCEVASAAAITVGRAGDRLTDVAALHAAVRHVAVGHRHQEGLLDDRGLGHARRWVRAVLRDLLG